MPAKRQTKAKPPEEPAEEELVEVIMLDPVMTPKETYNAGTKQQVPAELAKEWEEAGFVKVLES